MKKTSPPNANSDIALPATRGSVLAIGGAPSMRVLIVDEGLQGKMPKLGRTHEKRLLKFWVIYLGFVAVAWLVNYPGRLNNDSYTMLTQAQQHIDNLGCFRQNAGDCWTGRQCHIPSKRSM
jgi:hypothetical protein